MIMFLRANRDMWGAPTLIGFVDGDVDG
ncbi:TPA: hypothetical protein N0F65_000184 [Lagenidium giganteum]|uniref:Uncharacterized protein n=1 Tax=Lagenidium giganteum TaxID=4803 RepID=A0AAV2YS62_9STRA|nr:TPA: hypothetical protein N0F65_000184 [Lagenidium giganteum]